MVLILPEHILMFFQERLRFEILHSLLIATHNVSFVMGGDEIAEIHRKRDQGSLEVRSAEQCRFVRGGLSRDERLPDGDFPGYIDSRFESYNANQYFPGGFFICEGPAPDIPEHLERYVENIFFNKNVDIRHVLVAGQPNEGALFKDYFSSSVHTEDLLIDSREIINTATNIRQYHLFLTYKGVQKEVMLHQLSQMPDHHSAVLDHSDVAHLYELLGAVPPENLVAHCAAGLGRSPSILFAFMLFQRFAEVFHGDDLAICDNIATLLRQFRQIRPGSIQREAQLMQAIHLALKLKRVDWEHHPERFFDDLGHIKQLICILKTDSDIDRHSEIYRLLFAFNLFPILAVPTLGDSISDELLKNLKDVVFFSPEGLSAEGAFEDIKSLFTYVPAIAAVHGLASGRQLGEGQINSVWFELIAKLTESSSDIIAACWSERENSLR